MTAPPARRSLFALLLLPVLAGCASSGALREYSFRDRSLAVVALNTPRPAVLTNFAVDVDVTNPLQAALRIGADIAKEVEARRARPRLDSAAVLADVEGRMTARLLEGASRELRARPVEGSGQETDFELEVRVKRYGIDADNFFAPAHFRLEAEVILRDVVTGRRIWKTKVNETQPIGPAVHGGPVEAWAVNETLNDVITAAQLSSMSVAEMTRVLEALADFAGATILHRLHRGMERSRR